MADKRVHELTQAVAIGAGDFFPIDNVAFSEAKKYDATALEVAIEIGTLSPVAGALLVGNGSAWEIGNVSDYLAATGATTGATSSAQTFTNGIIGPTWKPASDSTTALQLQNSSGTAVLTVDTSNKRVKFDYVESLNTGSNYDLQLAPARTNPVSAHAHVKVSPSAIANNNIATLRSFQHLHTQYGSGTITNFDLYNVTLARAGSWTGTLTNANMFKIESPTGSTGTIASLYGLNIADMTGGGTANYAIYTGAGHVRFGDRLTVTQDSATALQIQTAGGSPVFTVDTTNGRAAVAGSSGAIVSIKGASAQSTPSLELNPADTPNTWFDIGMAVATQGLRVYGGTSYNTGPAFQIWPTGSSFQGMYFDAGNASGADILFRSSPSGSTAITIKQGTGLVGIGPTAPSAQLHVDQSNATAAVPVLLLDQADDSEEMIQFVATIGSGNPIEAAGANEVTPTHFIKTSIAGVGNVYLPAGTLGPATTYLAATGATTGATSQAQTFTNGIIGPTWKPASDSTSALQLQNSSGTAVVTIDTTNLYLGVNTTPSSPLHVGTTFTGSGSNFATRVQPTQSAAATAIVGTYNNVLHSATGTTGSATGFQSLVQNTSTGTLTSAYAAYVQVTNLNASGAIGSAYGMRIAAMSNAGTVVSDFGLYVDDRTAGSTNNYAIYTKAGRVRFGDTLTVTQDSATALQIQTAGGSPVLTVDTTTSGVTINKFLVVSGANAYGSFSSTSGNLSVSYSRPAGSTAGFFMQTAGANRWYMYVNATAEGGGSGGSDLVLNGYLDAGTPVDVMYAKRATGYVLFPQRMTVGGYTSPAARLHVDQESATGAIPALLLDQADDSEEMIEFTGTVGTGNAIEAVGAKTLTTTHFIKCTITGVGTVYIPVGTIA